MAFSDSDVDEEDVDEDASKGDVWHDYRAAHTDYVGDHICPDSPNLLAETGASADGGKRVKLSGVTVHDALTIDDSTEKCEYDQMRFVQRRIVPGCTVLIHGKHSQFPGCRAGELRDDKPAAPYVALVEGIYQIPVPDSKPQTMLTVRFFLRQTDVEPEVLQKCTLLPMTRAVVVEGESRSSRAGHAAKNAVLVQDGTGKELFLSNMAREVDAKHVMHPCLVNCIPIDKQWPSLALQPLSTPSAAQAAARPGSGGGGGGAAASTSGRGDGTDLYARVGRRVLRPGFACCRVYHEAQARFLWLQDAADLKDNTLTAAVEGLLRQTRERLQQAPPSTQWRLPPAKELLQVPLLPRGRPAGKTGTVGGGVKRQ